MEWNASSLEGAERVFVGLYTSWGVVDDIFYQSVID